MFIREKCVYIHTHTQPYTFTYIVYHIVIIYEHFLISPHFKEKATKKQKQIVDDLASCRC